VQQLPLWLVFASVTLNGLFLKRLLFKIDAVYNWLCGTPDTPGLADRVRRLESLVGLDPREQRHPTSLLHSPHDA
jgi:hypothetical protein